MKNWIKSCDDNEELILSSRIRIARNINRIPFPHKLDESKGREVIKVVEDSFFNSSYPKEGDFQCTRLWEENFNSNCVSLEKHLISKNLIDNRKKSAFIVNKDETISIMINEEDHIRIQCITAGLNLEEAYKIGDKLDNLLEEKIDYCFHEKLGYLTACPTNLGTGLRASAMIHLPALTLNSKINGVLGAVTQVGMTIRGLYGEGSKANGNIYQISNQVTLGLSEEDIINNLKAVVTQIIHEENLSREILMKKYKYEIEDRIYRALGVLRSAVLLSTNECLKLLSDVRLGVELGIIKDVKKEIINGLLIDIQSASLQNACEEKLSDKHKNIMRAKIVRERLG